MDSELPEDMIDPLLKKAIKIEQAKIKVKPYNEAVLNRSFGLGDSGFWGGAALGLVSGLAIGAIAIFALPAIMPGIALQGSALTALAKFAAAGVTIGTLSGQIIGASAGAAAAAAEERERREKGQALEAQILASPKLQQILKDKYADHIPEDMPANTFEEVLENSLDQEHFWKRMVRPKVLLLAGVLGAVVGAIMGAAGGIPILEIAGEATAAHTLYGAGIFSLMGMAFGVNYSALFTSICRGVNNMLNGNPFEKQKEKDAAPYDLALEQKLAQELQGRPITKLYGSRLDELIARGYAPGPQNTPEPYCPPAPANEMPASAAPGVTLLRPIVSASPARMPASATIPVAADMEHMSGSVNPRKPASHVVSHVYENPLMGVTADQEITIH